MQISVNKLLYITSDGQCIVSELFLYIFLRYSFSS